MKTIFAPNVTLEAIQKNAVNHFGDHIGLKFTKLGPDFLEGEMKVDDRHLRPGNIMNGGVSLALIETVGSVAARCAIYGEPKNTLGIQVNANHLAIAHPGDTLTVTARPFHVGKSTHVWEVTIVNQDKRTISRGTITMMVVQK